ncbi:hypothetical protein SynMEDNS5_02336 [Synechococcus sp. MEDNS5]|nr:hypothetical protein SynMEDNS5_02336 [Synechococcus sp. MEDNS5]
MPGELGGSIGTMVGEFTAKAINFMISLECAALASGLNAAIFDFFTALFKNIGYCQIGQLAMNLIQGVFGSFTGFIIGTAAAAKFITFIGFLGMPLSGVAATIAAATPLIRNCSSVSDRVNLRRFLSALPRNSFMSTVLICHVLAAPSRAMA